MKDSGYTAQNKKDGSLYLSKCGLHRERWKVEKWISELPEILGSPSRGEVRVVKCNVSTAAKRSH